MAKFDAIVVGSGPNGLAAATTLARAGLSVLVVEGHAVAGGGMRSAELTLPGYLHDVCASVVPLAAASPFMRSLPLEEHGLRFVEPEVALAHPLPGKEAVMLERSLESTAAGLGQDDRRYLGLIEPLVRSNESLVADLLGPLRIPGDPVAALRFGLPALLPAATLARRYFRSERAAALFAGLAAHSMLPLGRSPGSAVALILATLAHSWGWPFVAGGTGSLARALLSCLESLGGRVETGRFVDSLEELPPARLLLLDVTPRQLLALAGARFPPGYRRAIERYRYGPGVCKVDFALSAPIPWLDERCRRAGTVHLGGSLNEIERAERQVWRGEHPEWPFVLLAQPSLFDPTRAPAGRHVAWAYCHVPHASERDVSGAIEAQIERFAPGFRDLVLGRSVMSAGAIEAYDPNYVGGDINGGVQDLGQLYTRPAARLCPYSTPDPRIFICSSSTPPGGGVHGLSGYHAARAALSRLSG